MSKILNWLSKNIYKVIGVPIALNSLEFVAMLVHAMQDGIIDHQELEQLLKVGDGVSLIFLVVAMAYLKLKNK